MRYASVLALVVVTAFAALSGTATAQFDIATQNQKCTCECTCSPQPQTACNIDVYFVLDAASCVKEQWGEMLLRMNLFARRANNKKHLHTRFSVIRFATRGIVDIPIDSGMDYNQFIAELTKLQWLNEGSFLNTGLDSVEAEIQRNSNNHKKVILLVTNGKSHPDAKVDPEQLRRLSSSTGGQIYVNTLVPIEDNAFEESCDACDYNEKLFVQQAGFDARRQIISRDSLDSKVGEILSGLCPLNQGAETECNDCVCTCEAYVGPQGPMGHQGNPGAAGVPGRQGIDGAPGVNGYVGINGPNGANGCDGASGNPGKHGSPGAVGGKGRTGADGVVGPQGAAGGRGSGTGAKGLPGFPGEAGQQGEPGQDGLNGIDGPMGAVGLDGAEGERGENGERGPQGQAGKAGKPGQDGPPGYPGIVIDGAPGSPGQRGPNGPPGQRGPVGPAGPQGPQGFCGKVGGAGPKGVPGMQGPTGARGQVVAESNIENKIRTGVRSILEKLLPENRSVEDRVCGTGCQNYAEYAEKMYNQFIQIITEAPVVVTQPVVTRRPVVTDPVVTEPRPIETTTEQIVITEKASTDDFWDDDYTAPVVTEKPVSHGSGNAVDLVFMIETSDYMLNLDWDLVTSWVKRVITVAKSDPSKNVRSAIVVIRFNQSRHTMASLLQRKINEMKEALQEEAIVDHIVSDTFEALQYANSEIYNNLRHGSKRVLITITDGMHRDFDGSVSEENAAVLTETMTKYPVMIAIGLGSDVDARSLGPFASHEDKIFIDVTADRLNDITQAVLAEVEFHDEPSK